MANNLLPSKQELDAFFKNTQIIGSNSSNVADTLFGLDHQGIQGIIPEDKSSNGYAFFTKPQLNLSDENLHQIRKFYSLMTNNPNSIQRFVRLTLDPRLALEKKLTSTLLDTQMIFIPVLTNTLKTMSGWPDEVLPIYRSKQGVRREQQTLGDGAVEIYESFDIDCTFRNIIDSPLIIMFQTWIRYINYVFEGIMMPYSDFMSENEIDFNTRIYRLVMDETYTYVKQIASTGASLPITTSTGKIFDYNTDSKYQASNKEINMRFSCDGAIYNDPITILEFNKAVAIGNPEVMNMLLGNKNHSLVKIPSNLIRLFNKRGYPIINHNTFELEWWISSKSPTYRRIMNFYKENKNLKYI